MEVRRLRTHEAHLGLDALRLLKGPDGYPMPSVEYLSRFLTRSDNVLIVAIDGDQPVGYLVAYLLDRVDRDQQMMFFYEISVAETHHRRGVGAAMIRLLKACCREQGVMKMWVHTNKSNIAAMGLYQSTGGEADPSGDEITFLYTAESYDE